MMRAAATTALLLCFVATSVAAANARRRLQRRCPAKASPITPGRPAGTDYAGPNISVSVVQSRDACCASCSADPNCTMAVWYNHEPQLCALKADIEDQRPIDGSRVEAILPIPYIPFFNDTATF
eukprot:SAG25_NODE_6039_length_594_cov_2.282828_1_plen_124_part_00